MVSVSGEARIPRRPDIKQPPGLFITGTDTNVGKTVVAARIAADLVRRHVRVGVYKPAASGCTVDERGLVSDDAVAIWEAAGRPGELTAVCPQRFVAPLAPHLAARAAGQEIDAGLLRQGIEYWQAQSDVVIVEGAGGLLSPMGDAEYVADLAAYFGYPLVVVVPNRIGAINAALTTLIAAAAKGLTVAGLVLNDVLPAGAGDPSVHSNRLELERHCRVPVLAQLGHEARAFDRPPDWLSLAAALDA